MAYVPKVRWSERWEWAWKRLSVLPDKTVIWPMVLTNAAVLAAYWRLERFDTFWETAIALVVSLLVSVLVVPQFVLLLDLIRAPFAVAFEERQSKTYNMLASAHAEASELSLRNITLLTKPQWLAEVMAWRTRTQTEIRPRLQPHEWARVFGFYVMPPGVVFAHQVDVEHGQHMQYLNGMIEHLVTLMEKYAAKRQSDG